MNLDLDLMLINLTVLPSANVYAFSLLTASNAQASSFFLISSVQGRKYLDILWLRAPILWGWKALKSLIAPVPLADQAVKLDLDEDGRVRRYE